MRKKLKRFKDNRENKVLIEPGKPFFEKTKGHWHTFFGNKNPIVLELGCGTGRYAVTLAKKTPCQNFIGVDIKGARMWVGAETAKEQQLKNVAFLRIRIDRLTQFFAPGEVAEIHVTFPDPRPKVRDAKRRLTSKNFLNIYRQVIKTGGLIHVKTDNHALYEDALAVIASFAYPIIASTNNVYTTHPNIIHAQIQTVYEERFLAAGRTIRYVAFQVK